MAQSDTELTDEQERIKQQFTEERGYWSSLYDDLLRLDPTYLDRYRALSAHPWNEGVLDPKVKEFIYIAIDCSTTHLYNKGTRVHMQNAISYGATHAELMEVFELASVLGIHSITDSVPILVEEAKKRGKLPEDF